MRTAGRVAAASALLGGAAVWCGPGVAVHWPPMASALGVPLSLERHGVVLTYDDGPHPEGTPAVLETLSQAQAKAIFFLVGERVEAYPSLAQEIAAEGHEPAVHGYRHRNQMRLTPGTFAADLDRAVAVIGEACRCTPVRYRPPYGIFTLSGLARVRERALQPLLWSKWGRDWRPGQTPAEIASRATSGLARGDVILLHDADWYSASGSHRCTSAATALILEEMAERGLPAITA